jgi:hypothetical protein
LVLIGGNAERGWGGGGGGLIDGGKAKQIKCLLPSLDSHSIRITIKRTAINKNVFPR